MNPVHDLELHAGTRTLVAGTHGRSMLKLTLPGAAAVDDLPGAETAAIALAGPNPFADRAELRLRLPRAARVAVRVHDVTGRRVRDLIARDLAAGAHPLAWDGRDEAGRAVPAGTYFIRMEAEGRMQAIRVTRVAP
jgi:hypothetical protein